MRGNRCVHEVPLSDGHWRRREILSNLFTNYNILLSIIDNLYLMSDARRVSSHEAVPEFPPVARSTLIATVRRRTSMKILGAALIAIWLVLNLAATFRALRARSCARERRISLVVL